MTLGKWHAKVNYENLWKILVVKFQLKTCNNAWEQIVNNLTLIYKMFMGATRKKKCKITKHLCMK